MDLDPHVAKLFPLRLCEVLEREYVTLHGPLSYSSSWELSADQVSFAKLLERLRAAAGNTRDSAVRSIRRRLEESVAIPEHDDWTAEAERKVLENLNGALRDDVDLYDYDLLERDSETWRLARLHHDRRRKKGTSTGEGPPLTPVRDEQVQLNRLMLEAALPQDVIARIDLVRLGQLFSRIHAMRSEGRARTALCFSGGGIRSAAFSVGALQALARLDVLDKFDYLSTVSGGGYTGGWLSTWIHRHPDGLNGVTKALAGGAGLIDSKWTEKLEPVPQPLRFLRKYSHFLNPKAGFFSADTWSWVGIYLRNLSLNWLILIPLLLLLLGAPRLYVAIAGFFSRLEQPIHPALFWFATLAGVCSLVCVLINRPSASEPAKGPEQLPGTKVRPSGWQARLRERLRSQHAVLALGLAPLLVFLALLTLFLWALPAGRPHIPWDKALALLTTSSVLDLPRILAFVAIDHIVLWGEAIVLIAWLSSLMLLPHVQWKRRLLELLAMLVAGFVTWALVHWFADLVALAGSERRAGVWLFSFKFYSEHAYAVLGVPVVAAAVLAGMTAFIGLVSKPSWIEDEDREWWARFGAWILITILAWAALGSIAIFGPPLLLESPKWVAAVGGISGLVGVLLGKSALTPAHMGSGRTKEFLAVLNLNALALVAIVFLIVFLAFLSLVSSAVLQHLPGSTSELLRIVPTAQQHLDLVRDMPLSSIGMAMIALLVLLAVASWAVNLNKFSLHAAYRIRIARTFLGASRGRDRRPNPFTGFDPLDNVYMHELQPGLLRDTDLTDLEGFVRQLNDALHGKPTSSDAKILVERLCAPEHDAHGALRGSLSAYTLGEPALVSLQRDLLEALNRLLESDRLDLSGMVKTRVEANRLQEAVRQYIEHDNRIFANRLVLESAFPQHIKRYDFPPPPPHKLLHVINLSLNLVKGRKLAWQERKAAPFVVTPMHAGSYYLGYRQARDYGGPNGISIATAAAISGAAVSPNMGYSSSPVTAFLLTLFNVRLGWWLGNPGSAGTKTYHASEPKFSVRPLISEALGLTDDRSPYVYLSDGGHFDNLGLFEMVLRRCQLIVVIDASSDPDYRFGDLGNAVRKIQIDLNVPIEFDEMPIHRAQDANDRSGRYCALGRIRYSKLDGNDVQDGVLIYFKPVLCGNEPRDVLQYHAYNPLFPHETTIDQFFGETQFESYRRLAEFAITTVLASSVAPGTWHERLHASVREHIARRTTV